MNRCKMLMVPSSQLYPTVIVPLGKNATIKCNGTFSAQLPVSLVKNGKNIETSKGGFRSHIFSIANVKQEHGGLYKCCYGQDANRDAYGRDEAVELLIRDPHLPRPRVSFGSVEVGIGKDFTIHCRVQGKASKFYFQKDGKQIPHQHPFESKITIQTASKEDAGNYSCSYSLPFLTSEPSAPVELLITDTRIPRPTISSNPGVLVALGGQVAIQCEIQDPPVMFYLHKTGNPTKIIMLTNNKIGKYYFKNFSSEDQGWYTCSCAFATSPFVVSERSSSLELLLDEESRLTIPIAIGVCATLLFLFLLLVLLWYKRRRDALLEATQTSGERSFRVLRAHWVAKPTDTSTPGGGHMGKQPPKDDSSTQPKDIIYAELRKTSSDNQEEAEPDNDIVYTTVIVH